MAWSERERDREEHSGMGGERELNNKGDLGKRGRVKELENLFLDFSMRVVV